jgi:hypothetical protein
MLSRGRLVIVVPDVAEPALLASRIHAVAAAGDRDALIIGVVSSSVSESALRRKLALLAAFVREAGTNTEVRIERDRSWISALRGLLGAGDLLACSVDDRLPASGEPWIELLARTFRRDIYAFMDSDPTTGLRPGLTARLAPWLVPSAIILAFFWLQVRISQTGTGAITTGLLMGSVVVEIGLIALSNALLG